MIYLWLSVPYLACGIAVVSVRCWFVGTHRARHHEGEREYRCSDWACGLFADDGPTITLATIFWPLALPMFVLGWWFRLMLHGPYLRSLPVKNEHPTARRID